MSLEESVQKLGVFESCHRYIIYLLYNDDEQNVRVEEVEELDFARILKHLSFGGSVFITHRTLPIILDSVLQDEETFKILSE